MVARQRAAPRRPHRPRRNTIELDRCARLRGRATCRTRCHTTPQPRAGMDRLARHTVPYSRPLRHPSAPVRWRQAQRAHPRVGPGPHSRGRRCQYGPQATCAHGPQARAERDNRAASEVASRRQPPPPRSRDRRLDRHEPHASRGPTVDTRRTAPDGPRAPPPTRRRNRPRRARCARTRSRVRRQGRNRHAPCSWTRPASRPVRAPASTTASSSTPWRYVVSSATCTSACPVSRSRPAPASSPCSWTRPASQPVGAPASATASCSTPWRCANPRHAACGAPGDRHAKSRAHPRGGAAAAHDDTQTTAACAHPTDTAGTATRAGAQQHPHAACARANSARTAARRGLRL